jgi:hypothetical protein
MNAAKVQKQCQRSKEQEELPGRQAALEGIHAAKLKKAPHRCGAQPTLSYEKLKPL